MGSMNTKKQTAHSRKPSLKKLESGEWLINLNKTLDNYTNEKDLEIKENLKSALVFKSMTWGINNFPELKQYVESKINMINNNENIEKLTPKEFVNKWVSNKH